MRVLFSAILVLGVIFGASMPAGGAPYVIGYDETKSLVSGKTMMTYDRGHGTQVEYIAPNGKTHLFYPGNSVIVKGSWKLTKTKTPNVFDMCFRYPSNSYNPTNGQKGGAWECQPAGFYLRDVVETADGDVLGLAKRDAVPFVLSKKKTRFNSLIRLVKK
jgi:hypothetical protein